MKLNRPGSSVPVFSTADRLILMVTLNSRFTNFMRLLPLVELTKARIPRTRVLCDITGSSLSRRPNIFAVLCPLFSFSSSSHTLVRLMFVEKRILSVFYPAAGNTGPQTSRTSESITFPGFFNVFKRTPLFMPLGADLPRDRRTCRRKILCAPLCQRVLNASAIHPVERSLRFMIKNIPLMGMNHAAH